MFINRLVNFSNPPLALILRLAYQRISANENRVHLKKNLIKTLLAKINPAIYFLWRTFFADSRRNIIPSKTYVNALATGITTKHVVVAVDTFAESISTKRISSLIWSWTDGKWRGYARIWIFYSLPKKRRKKERPSSICEKTTKNYTIVV